jgi:hypothetical protein
LTALKKAHIVLRLQSDKERKCEHESAAVCQKDLPEVQGVAPAWSFARDL